MRSEVFSHAFGLSQRNRFVYEETWIALNWRITPPTKETHPKFPLWERGYSPEEVYDFFFPKNFRFICDPDRPAVCGRFGNGAERLYRFEFVVKKEEDPWRTASREKTNEIWLPYMTHSGSKYGYEVLGVRPLFKVANLKEACPFQTFSSLKIASKSFDQSLSNFPQGHATGGHWAGPSLWEMLLTSFRPVSPRRVSDKSRNLTILVGGQGIASGFRDASGLAWRLKIACGENTKNFPKLLDGWYRERKQQLDKSLAATIVNGRLCTEANTWIFAFIKFLLRLIQLIPAGRHWLELGPRRGGMTRYKWQEGLPFLPDFNGGISLPQVYCAPIDPVSTNSQVTFTDDVIFRPDKDGLFQIVVLLGSLAELDEAREALHKVDKLPDRYVIANEVTYIVQNSEPRSCPGIGPDVFRLATAEDFISTGSLCYGRPEPQFYDMYRMKKDLGGKRFAVVRPDRFLYAACDTAEDLEHICSSIQQTLGLF